MRASDGQVFSEVAVGVAGADSWALGWDAVAALATATAAVVALVVWLVDRRSRNIESASLVIVEVEECGGEHRSSPLDADLERELAERLEKVRGISIDPDVSLKNPKEQSLQEALELQEMLGGGDLSLEWDAEGRIHQTWTEGQRFRVTVENHSSRCAFDIFLLSPEARQQGRIVEDIRIDVLVPRERRVYELDSNRYWGGHPDVEFTMGGHGWSLSHGKPAKRIRRRLPWWRNLALAIRWKLSGGPASSTQITTSSGERRVFFAE